MNRTQVLAAVGVLATMLGLAAVAGISILGSMRLLAVIPTLVGLVAVVQGLRQLKARNRAIFDAAETGEPERRYRVPTPGDDFPANLRSRTADKRLQWERDRVREHLRETAIETLSSQGNYSREQAREAVEQGTWTDDPVAAAFLADGMTVSMPLAERARELFTRRPVHLRRAARTIDALAEVDHER